MAKEYLDKNGLTYLWAKLKALFNNKQNKLTPGSGINIDSNDVISATSGGGDMYKSVYDTDNDGKVDSAEDSDSLGGVAASSYALKTGLFKIVPLEVSIESISAHSYITASAHTVPSADRPAGMVLLGVVGVQSSNYRIYPYNYRKTGTHTITAGFTNSTAGASAAATVTFHCLYANATLA